MPKSLDMAEYPWKCHSDEALLETAKMERGKPHERETQTMVGELSWRNQTERRTVIFILTVDRWLPPEYESKIICSTKVQNMAYWTLLEQIHL